MIIVVGLGRMGRGILTRLSTKFEAVGFDRDPVARKSATDSSLKVTDSLSGAAKLAPAGKRIFWLSVPAGGSVDAVLGELPVFLAPGDIVLESGNSHYKDSVRRGNALQGKAHFLDVGISGGVHGAREGYCLMVGGEQAAFDLCLKYFEVVATPTGVRHVGALGAGHYVKMVHNAIEYGILQVLGEGLFLMKEAPYDLKLDEIVDLWMHGSVIRGWLLELVGKALKEPGFTSIADEIGGGETGKWAVQEAMDRRVPIPAISTSLMERFGSRFEENFGNKVIAALRQQFGGHEVKAK